MTHFRIPAAPACATALLWLMAGCANSGASAFHRAERLTWYGFLNGDDLRAACGADSPDHYRLILTDDRTRRVHIYEVMGEAAAHAAAPAGGAAIEARAIALSDLARVDLSDPVEPATGTPDRTRLDAGQFGRLKDRLAEVGVFEAVPDDQHLPAGGFTWLVSGCHDGRFFFSSYSLPTPEYRDVELALRKRHS